jgi:hypothetical protein
MRVWQILCIAAAMMFMLLAPFIHDVMSEPRWDTPAEISAEEIVFPLETPTELSEWAVNCVCATKVDPKTCWSTTVDSHIILICERR